MIGDLFRGAMLTSSVVMPAVSALTAGIQAVVSCEDGIPHLDATGLERTGQLAPCATGLVGRVWPAAR
jgi:hypothetical protein